MSAQFFTERLIATPLGELDYAELRALHADSRAADALSGDGQPIPPEGTREFLARCANHWSLHGFGIWGFRDRSTNAFVGYAGLEHTGGSPVQGVELLYAVNSNRWNSGLDTEMARATLEHGSNRASRAAICAFTLPANTASRRVMEKLGFHFAGEIVHANLPHVLYRLQSPA